jgi:MFS family permease
MMLGVVASSMLGGRYMGKLSYRNILLGASLILILATLLLGTISVDSKRWLITIYMVFMGLGIGASYPVISMSSLHNVDPGRRGSVTSLVTFFRSIGSAIGVTVLGSVQVHMLAEKMKQALPDSAHAEKFKDARVLLQPQVRSSIPANTLNQMIIALAQSIATVFQIALVMAVIGMVFVFMMGNAKMEMTQARVKESVPAH